MDKHPKLPLKSLLEAFAAFMLVRQPTYSDSSFPKSDSTLSSGFSYNTRISSSRYRLRFRILPTALLTDISQRHTTWSHHKSWNCSFAPAAKEAVSACRLDSSLLPIFKECLTVFGALGDHLVVCAWKVLDAAQVALPRSHLPVDVRATTNAARYIVERTHT